MSFWRVITLYDLRSYIDDYNCTLIKIAKETGLVFTLFKFKDGEYKDDKLVSGEIGFYSQHRIGEIKGPKTVKYEFFKCDNTNCEEFARKLRNLMNEFMHAYRQRQTLLADFQRVWNNAKLPDHSPINVHYGIYFAQISILLETMDRYRIHVRRDTPFTGYDLYVINGWLVLSFNWHESILTSFDNIVFLLECKIDEYNKSQEAKRNLMAYHENYQIFWHWEQKIVTT